MRTRQVLVSLTVCMLAASVAVVAPTKSLATTGPSQFLTGSRYNVPLKLAQPYVGRYQLIFAARGAQIRTGAMGIEIESTHHNLYGVAQFAGYEQGFQSIWIATLYNFHQSGAKLMVFDVLAQTGGTLLGRMFVTRAKNGDLIGQIQFNNGRFAITWHKVSK